MSAEGHAVSVIARAIGTEPRRLLAVAKRLALPITRHARRSGITDAQIQEMVEIYLDGDAGTKELAAHYGLVDTTVARYLRARGVPIRPAGFQEGAGHHAWKGGRVLTEDGYILVLVQPDDPLYCMAQVKTTDKKYCLEHRYVMARTLGRPLRNEETVHHKDGNRQNNAPDNLQLRQGKHGKGTCFRCADCGSYNIKAEEIGAS